MKTKKQWDESKKGFTEFCQAGDKVDADIYHYFLGVLPPVKMGCGYLMMGEPYSYNDEGQKTYMTFKTRNDKYEYLGLKSVEEMEM